MRDLGFGQSGRVSGPVPWDSYATFVERLEVAAGGQMGLEHLVVAAGNAYYPQISALARRIVSPQLLVHALAAFVARNFPADTEVQFLSPERIQWGVVLRPGARPSFSVMRATLGTVRIVPNRLGLSVAADVDAEVSTTRGVFSILAPPSSTIARVLENAALIHSKIAPLFSSNPRQSLFPEKLAPLDEVGLQLVQRFGAQLASCASSDALLNQVVRLARCEFGYEEASIWQLDGINVRPLAHDGQAASDSALRVYNLRVAGKTIGRLEVRGGDRSLLLEALIPWLSLAFASALTYSQPARASSLASRLERLTGRRYFTPRQAEVLRAVLQGFSNKEIAAQLSVSEKTVELHVSQIYRRAGVSGRLQLAAWFFDAS